MTWRGRPQRQHMEADRAAVAAAMLLEARAEVRRLQAVLGRMKLGHATALVLHDVYDYSMPEVARLLGISLSAAESRLRRARVELVRRGNNKVSGAFAPGAHHS